MHEPDPEGEAIGREEVRREGLRCQRHRMAKPTGHDTGRESQRRRGLRQVRDQRHRVESPHLRQPVGVQVGRLGELDFVDDVPERAGPRVGHQPNVHVRHSLGSLRNYVACDRNRTRLTFQWM